MLRRRAGVFGMRERAAVEPHVAGHGETRECAGCKRRRDRVRRRETLLLHPLCNGVGEAVLAGCPDERNVGEAPVQHDLVRGLRNALERPVRRRGSKSVAIRRAVPGVVACGKTKLCDRHRRGDSSLRREVGSGGKRNYERRIALR